MWADLTNTAECTASGMAGKCTRQVNNFFSCYFIELQLHYELFPEICRWDRIQHIF